MVEFSSQRTARGALIFCLGLVMLLPARRGAAEPQQDEVRAAIPVYEELPLLKASEILKPEFLSGPHFKVQEDVPTSSGANHFTIESDYGLFDADGNDMLVTRVGEIEAIARLKDVSRGEQYKDALIKAAKSPLAAAKAIVTDPVQTISNVPKGIMKFMGRVGDSVKNIGEKREGDNAEGSQMEQLIGYSKTRRNVAVDLGVDPYTTNEVLKHELDGIAWASYAGGATFMIGTLPVGGAVGTALTVTRVSGNLEQVLREKSPAELKQMNRATLVAMGASGQDADRLLNNSAFSPSVQTAFVLNLKGLNGVENRRAFVRLAGATSSSQADALFCVKTAKLLGDLNNGATPLARIETLGDFPVAVAKDGTMVAALQWDYAAWTAGAANFSGNLQKMANQPGRNKKVLIAISGDASQQLRQESEAAGRVLQDRVSPGPLK